MFVHVPEHLGYAALAGLILGESAGLPIPGETALIGASLLAAAGHLNLALAIVIAAGSAILGDNLGFWFGRRGGRRALSVERGPFQRHRAHLLRRGEAFFARHGDRAVFLARWVAGVRVVAAVVAGASGMRVRRFVAANALGAVTWATSTALLVFLLGSAGAVIAFVSGWTLAGVGIAVGAWQARRRAGAPSSRRRRDEASAQPRPNEASPRRPGRRGAIGVRRRLRRLVRQADRRIREADTPDEVLATFERFTDDIAGMRRRIRMRDERRSLTYLP